MSNVFRARLALGLLCTLALALAAAPVQATTTHATVAIDNCHVKRGGSFTWFYCGVTSEVPTNTKISVSYRVNLVTFKPNTGGTWDKRSGTLHFGYGQSLQNLKFAVRNLSAAQVKKRLRVVLSEARGATITDATAVAT